MNKPAGGIGMMKKLLALLLAVCLTAGFLAVPAAAADTAGDAVAMVQALGIMTGDGAGFQFVGI